MRSGGYGIGSMARYVGGFNPARRSMYASMGTFFGGSAGAVYRMCHRVAHYESHYGYSRYGRNDATKYNRVFAQCMRFMPRWAPEAKNDSSSAAPQQAQQPQQPQKAGGSNQANASGASKTSPEEAKRKQKAEQKEARHDAAVENLKKLRGDPEGESDAAREGTAVSSLETGKGYSRDEAKKIVAMINKMVPMGFDGDPVRAEAALKKYQNYRNGVPARKDGKGNKLPHAQWAAAYATWLGDKKGVKPSEGAQIPISDVMGVTGKGKRKKISKKKAKHVQLISIGLEKAKGGKVYDAFKAVKSSDQDVVRDGATVLRDRDGDKDKWFLLKGDGSLQAIKRGRRSDPVFDERGILNIDPRFKEIALVPIKGKDAGDINSAVENWIAKNPSVKTKRDMSDKRADYVKKALEKRLHGRFGRSVVSVSAEGKNVNIRILGDEQQRSKRAKAVAVYMKDHEGHFASIFGDLAEGAVVKVQDKDRVSAQQKGTFRGVVSAIKKLHTNVSLRTLDIRKFVGRGKDAVPSVKYVESRVKKHLPDSDDVAGKKVVVKLRYAKGFKPDEKAIKEFVEKRFKKDGREVKVVFEEMDVAKPAGYDSAKVVELKKRLKAALWDGSKRGERKSDKKADLMLKNAQTGGGYRRTSKRPVLLPIKAAAFENKVNARLRKHADEMRRKVIAAKGTKKHDQLVTEYKAWWAVAKEFLGKSADYYKPDKVEKEHPRAAAVYRLKRRGKRGRKRKQPVKEKGESPPKGWKPKKGAALMSKGRLKAMYANGLGTNRKPKKVGTGCDGKIMWRMPNGKIQRLPKGVQPIA